MTNADKDSGADRSVTSIELSIMTRRYLRWLKEHNYSQYTINCRQSHFRRFLEWTLDRDLTQAGEITRRIMENYQSHLFHMRKKNGKALNPKTQNQHLATISHFFNWLVKQELVLYNPVASLDFAKVGKQLPRTILTASEVETILNGIDLTTIFGLRDRAIIETFYSTGIRRGELAELEIYDLNMEQETLFIRQGKGKIDRMVPIGERALQWINRYLQQSRPLLACASESKVLFLTQRGQGFSREGLAQTVRSYVLAARLGKDGSCHIFRHTMATLMLENGADIRFIQKILGHSRLETTSVYTHVSLAKLKEVHKETHPAGVVPLSEREGRRSKNLKELRSELDLETDLD